ncbi:glycosyltransferase family 4 protein [Sphingomonas sp.]|uniref:glycosyltransferase family 4 protein n=1 Tax=Sphingomonas sp. TaxID=28214 RepID=UPI003CC6960E
MKVLMTCDAVGGVWQYATDLAQALAGDGVEVVLAVLGPVHACESGYPTSVELVHTNLALDWLAAGPEEVRHTGRAIAALAAEHRVDVIHLNSPALAAAGPFPAPVVAVAHGCIATWFDAMSEAPPAHLAWHADLVRAGLNAASAVFAPSAAYAAAVQRRYGLGFAPQVVHNGRTPAALAAAQPADHVFTAGRLWDRVKRTPLLDAVAALLPVPFRAAGPVTAPHGERVETSHLHLLGTLDAEALAAEYARQPVFVSAACFEPFGLAVLEAAQAGCPLVLAGIETFRELWAGAALLVPEGDPAAYGAAIARIRGDAGLRAHLSQAAQARALRYTPAAMAAGTLAVYRDLLLAPERRAA